MSGQTATEAMAASDLESSVQSEDKLELKVWLRLLTCSTMIDQRVRSGLRRRFRSTLPRFDFLSQLDRAPEGLTMGELSSRLMVSNGNVTGLADRLVQEGLVSRSAVPNDRRTQMVRLTRKGKRAFDAMTPAHEAWVGEMMAGMSRSEMSALLDLLGNLKRSLKRSQENGKKA